MQRRPKPLKLNASSPLRIFLNTLVPCIMHDAAQQSTTGAAAGVTELNIGSNASREPTSFCQLHE